MQASNLSDMQITKVSKFVLYEGSKGREVVTALIPYQYGPRLNPGVEAICGLNFLLVLSLAARGFSPSSPVFPFQLNTAKFQFDLECMDMFK